MPERHCVHNMHRTFPTWLSTFRGAGSSYAGQRKLSSAWHIFFQWTFGYPWELYWRVKSRNHNCIKWSVESQPHPSLHIISVRWKPCQSQLQRSMSSSILTSQIHCSMLLVEDVPLTPSLHVVSQRRKKDRGRNQCSHLMSPSHSHQFSRQPMFTSNATKT